MTARKREPADDHAADQVALDLATILERVRALEAPRIRVDREAEALATARREVRHRTRTLREAQWNLAYWQRVVERCGTRKGDANGQG